MRSSRSYIWITAIGYWLSRSSSGEPSTERACIRGKWCAKPLKHNGAAVIFMPNHPSGVAEPSDADRRLTTRLKDALALVDIRVLDHFVVGDGEVVSFAERGWL